MARILHVTDSHEYVNGINDAISLANYVKADLNICTGDIVQDYFEQSVTQGLLSNFACTIGNHDAILKAGTDPNGYHWEMRATPEQLYKKFVEPSISKTGISIEPNHTFWTKDISDAIMVIGLNDTADDDEQALQKQMLTEKLNVCRQDNRKAIIASHFMNYNCKVNLKCNFTCKSYFKNWNSATEPSLYRTTYKGIPENYEIIESYSDVVLFTVHGHEHSDAIAFSNNVHIVLGSILNDTYNNVGRTNDARVSRTVANLYEISDENPRYLVVYRLGANICKTGQIRSMVAIDLQTHDIVSSYSL